MKTYSKNDIPTGRRQLRGPVEVVPVPNHRQIRLLEANPNKRGDLFGKLMQDLFFALGYEQFRLNIHKSGRELDLEGLHRTEKRRVIAECKATQNPIGGDDVNKFVGALDAEKRRYPQSPTVGYFVSLSGFTETAIEQEKEIREERVILLNGEQVIEELIDGRIIVRENLAMELAGRCAADQSSLLRAEEAGELLAHELGWIWLIHFSTGKLRTHFALVHADGTPIAPELSEILVEADSAVLGRLRDSVYLKPPTDRSVSERHIQEVRKSYFDYVAKECGEIPLEGLPADQEVRARQLKLEDIFVPLHLIESSEADVNLRPTGTGQHVEPHREESSRPEERLSLGSVLARFGRLAVLGPPGSGKSTLLRRLAIAYAFPDRRKLIEDKLPDRAWLPLFIRCRQLGESVRQPIHEIIQDLRKRAEISDESADAFALFVSRTLRSGEALILVDGLDEISNESDRVAFVNQLRTFLSTYLSIAVVVTSREAGFRIIGNALSTHCKHYKLADFDEQDVKRLTVVTCPHSPHTGSYDIVCC